MVFKDFSEPIDADRIAWVLQMMIRSSKTREDYFKRTIEGINYAMVKTEIRSESYEIILSG